MDFKTYNFRNAIAILNQRPEWNQLCDVIRSIKVEEIVDKQKDLIQRRNEPPKGAQTAMNEIFKDRLTALNWQKEVRLLKPENSLGNRNSAGWKMDFLVRGAALPHAEWPDFGMGLEVSFNHAEAIPWTLIRMNLAAQFEEIRESSRIDVGVGIFASQAFKAWGRLDGACGTFEQAQRWLTISSHTIPTPIVLIGLNPRDSTSPPEWKDPGTEIFSGTGGG